MYFTITVLTSIAVMHDECSQLIELGRTKYYSRVLSRDYRIMKGATTAASQNENNKYLGNIFLMSREYSLLLVLNQLYSIHFGCDSYGNMFSCLKECRTPARERSTI